MEEGWVVPTRKPRKKKIILKNDPPVTLDEHTWNNAMYEIDQDVYTVLLESYPNTLSPEEIERRLNDTSYRINDIWDSLDDTLAPYVMIVHANPRIRKWRLKSEKEYSEDSKETLASPGFPQ
jgi:hypothetical protein